MKKNIIKSLTILIFICIDLFNINAQSSQLVFKTFSSKDGISDLTILSIVRDKNDFLWLGTPKGLYIYDSHIAIPFQHDKTLATTHITSIIKDKTDKIWIGTLSEGLFCINTDNNSVVRYYYRQNNSYDLPSNRINALTLDNNGNIWVSTAKTGINFFNSEKKSFENIKISDFFENENLNRTNTILAMTPDFDEHDILWLGTLDGLIKFNTKENKMDKFKCDKPVMINPESYNSRENTVKAVYSDKEKLYLGTWGGGLCIFNKKTTKWECIKFQSPFPASGMRNDVTHILPKSNDELWVIAYRKPLGIFKKKTKELKFLKRKNIRTIYKDEYSNFWFGTTSKGLLALFPEMQQFKKINLPFTLENIVFHPDKNILYAGINFKSLLLELNLDDYTYKTYKFKPYFDKGVNFFTNLQFDKENHLYLLGLTGVYRFDEKNKKILPVFSPFEHMENAKRIISTTDFYIDKRNNCWLGTKYNGLYRFNLKTKEFKHYPPNEIRAHTGWISCFFEDSKENIWYGTGNGFGYYNYKIDSFIEFPNSINNTFPDSLPFSSINSITEDNNKNIWIGSYKKGIGVFKAETHEPFKIKTYTTESSNIRSDNIYNMLKDDMGNIWFITKSGLSVYSPGNKRFDNYGKDFGLTGLRYINIKNNNIYLSSINGFYIFSPENLNPNSYKTKVHLTKFKIFDSDYFQKQNIDLTDTINLTYKQNFFSIEYTGIDYKNPQLIQYKYKLEGLHNNWINAGKRGYIAFTNVGGGEYTLKIKAGTGNEFGTAKELKIIITPPFWETWWFWSIITGSLILGSYYWFRDRIKTIRKEEKMKNEFEKRFSEIKLTALQSQMNPHFLFNSLNSIKLLTLNNQSEKASEYLTKFSRLIRLILKSSRFTFIPLADEIEALKIYIEMEALRFEEEFTYSIEIDDNLNINSYKVPPMIIQIFIENSIKHGLRPKESNKTISIKFKIENSYLVCVVKDNGIGREAVKKMQERAYEQKKSMGIDMVKERLAHINRIYNVQSKIEIKDLYQNNIPSGTKVTIFFPIL